MLAGAVCAVANVAIVGISYPIYLRYLGLEQYGLWLVLSTIIVFAQLGNLGLGPAVSKLVAQEAAKRDFESALKYVTIAGIAVLLSGVVICGGLLGARRQILLLLNLTPSYQSMVTPLLPAIALLSVYVMAVDINLAGLQGLGRLDLDQYARTVSQASAVLASVLLLRVGLGLKSLIIGNAIAYVALHAAALIFTRRITGVLPRLITPWEPARVRRLAEVGLNVFGSSLVAMFLSPFNRLVLARFGGLTAVPLYDVAYNTSMRLRGLLDSGTRALMPEVSRLATDTGELERAQIHRLYAHTLTLVAALGVPVFLVPALFASDLLRLWLGSAFQAGVTVPTITMLFGAYVSLVSVPAFYCLLGLGRPEKLLVASLWQSGLNVTIIVTFLLFAINPSPSLVTVAVAAGMCGSTIYLMWHSSKALKAPLTLNGGTLLRCVSR